MEGSSGSSFGIDTILSSTSNSGNPVLMNGDFRLSDSRTADFRSPSPCSEIDTVGTAPSSPISVTMEHAADAHLVQDSLQHHHHHHNQPQSLPLSPQQQPLAGAGCAPRTATSSFLIKDILGDSKPLAACAPYSTTVSSPHHTPKPESANAPDGFRPKLEQDENRSKLDRRDDIQSDMKCNGRSIKHVIYLRKTSLTQEMLNTGDTSKYTARNSGTKITPIISKLAGIFSCLGSSLLY